MTKEALKLSLYGLEIGLPLIEDFGSTEQLNAQHKAIAAIYEALAQPEPWEKFCDSNCVWTDHHPDCKLAQRTWVGLTDEEILDKCESVPDYDIGNHDLIQFARAIEAKLKEKNT